MISPPHLLDSSRWAGQRVGLFGGSFNPAHYGHVHTSLIAIKMLKLDFVWWMVTPQNPLKKKQGMAPYHERIDSCHKITHHPQIIVSDIENQMKVRLTSKTVQLLRLNYPKTDFVFITGMDNALTMHTWNNWKQILDTVPTAHIARPPTQTTIQMCPLRMLETQNHHFLQKPSKIDMNPGSTYWILQQKQINISSTKIRNGK